MTGQAVQCGPVYVTCPEQGCDTEIPVTVTVQIVTNPDDPRKQYLLCLPDTTDVWAHAFTH